jgi:hypothetical protein
MKTIIAGSRTITDSAELEKAIQLSGFKITEVLSGGALGPDTLGANWAKANNIPVKYFYPDWKTYGKAAGPIRNSAMVAEAEGAIFLWDGISRGTKDCITKAEKKALAIYIHKVERKEENSNETSFR